MNEFEIISVNYNTPDLLERLLTSIRQNYNQPIRIIDGSDTEEFRRLAKMVCDKFTGITLEQLGYNIHHGRGLDYAIASSTLDWCMCIDSDCEILQGMFECFKFTHAYEGFCCSTSYTNKYVHPEILLVDVQKYRHNPNKFIKHGEPAIKIMRDNNMTDRLCMPEEFKKFYIRHGRGTCGRFGYNL